ncbi:MAG: GtrA family protein [Muribaculaceae bacterium]|nr:GtrA family protein [Muribaculaceae bacterium]MDE6345096.1 GtrA family protein [Muribaculaceae bacterium]
MKKKEIKKKFLHGGGIFMFLRSVVTSQISAYTDFIVSFVFYALISLSAGISAMIGATAGGIVNCLINYKFTFRMRESSYLAIGIKFFLVWLGSLLLNTFGTQYLTNLLDSSSLLDSVNMVDNIRFTIARILTSIVVSVFWNFMLQRYFVFRATAFDNFIDRCHYFLHATFSKRY